MVTIRLYNILGQLVKTLVDGIEDVGFKSVQWNGTNNVGNVVASGVYFYRIEASGVNDAAKSFMQVRKMLLLR
jgi:flagellar hook assembly protein FlgD